MGLASSLNFVWGNQYDGKYGLSATFWASSYGVYTSMQIDFGCNPKVGIGAPIFLGQNTTSNTFYFYWETQYACQIYDNSPPATYVNGMPIFIIFGVLAVLFCIAGCCVRRCVRRRQQQIVKQQRQQVDIQMESYPSAQRQVSTPSQPQPQPQLQLQPQAQYPYMPVYPVQYYPGAPMSVPMGSPYPQYYVPSYTAIPQQEPQQQIVPQVQLDKLDE